MSRPQGRPGWRCSACPERGNEETEAQDVEEFEKHYRRCNGREGASVPSPAGGRP